MPAHAAGTVVVKVVSLGIAGTGSYTYNTGPALLFPAPPGGEVGVAYSDQLTVTGGTSPFTWSVSAGHPAAGADPRVRRPGCCPGRRPPRAPTPSPSRSPTTPA